MTVLLSHGSRHILTFIFSSQRFSLHFLSVRHWLCLSVYSSIRPTVPKTNRAISPPAAHSGRSAVPQFSSQHHYPPISVPHDEKLSTQH